MKKILFSTMLLIAVVQFKAQTTIFEETFESTPDYAIPSGWNNHSINNTFWKWFCASGSNWSNLDGFSGKYITVGKYNTTDDQSLVTPAINLAPGNSYSLSFLIGSKANQVYAVYVLPATSTFLGTETPILQETISINDTALQKIIDLSAYAGQNIKIYFRSFGLATSDSFVNYNLDTVRIIQQPQLGTSDVKQAVSIGVYPNPTSDYVYLKSNSKITKAEVFDAAGRKVDASFSDNRLDIKNLQPGTYMVRFTESNKTYSQKIIKK